MTSGGSSDYWVFDEFLWTIIEKAKKLGSLFESLDLSD